MFCPCQVTAIPLISASGRAGTFTLSTVLIKGPLAIMKAAIFRANRAAKVKSKSCCVSSEMAKEGTPSITPSAAADTVPE